MLKDYFRKIRQSRQDNPISRADFEAWRLNAITKQLFEDFEELKLQCSDDIHAHDETAGLQAAKLNGLQDSVGFLLDWEPECFGSDNDEEEDNDENSR